MRSGKTGAAAGVASVMSVAASTKRLKSCWSVTSAETAFTLSAWDPTILQDPPRKESGFVLSVFAVKVVEPPNQERLGMPSGHMTSPCVMTVPNVLQKETSALSVINAMMKIMRIR